MPTYEYKCILCSHTFEIFQSIKAEPLKECPVCKGEIRRLIGPGAGPIFKGTGFYHTDYKKAPEDKSKNTESKTSPEGKKGSSEKK